MSEQNPYSTPQTFPAYVPSSASFRRVFSNPFALLERAYQMVSPQYGLFLGVTFVGAFIAAIVPFYICLGPMMIGIYSCFLKHEAGRQFEFNDLFKGFDQFANGLIACLLMLVAAPLVLIAPLFILFGIGAIINDPTVVVITMLLFFLGIFSAALAIGMAFIFVFPLMAEYQLAPIDAIKLSARAAFSNFGSVLINIICMGLIGGFLALMCIIPVILFMPIARGWMFLLYRDVFPKAQMPAGPALH